MGCFDTLVTALGVADLVGTLSAPSGPFTVFASTNASFDDLPDGIVDCLLKLENLEVLTTILTSHVISVEVWSTGLSDGMTTTTLAEEYITVDLTDGVKINDLTVTVEDIGVSNGAIHTIDAVLVPPSIGVFVLLAACIEAPAPEVSEGPAADTNLFDIPQTAIAVGYFDTLVQVLGAADLVATLSAPSGPITVSAPTDAAFDDIPDGIVDCLLRPDNLEALTTTQTYHMIKAEFMSTCLSDGMTTTTLAKEDIIVDLTDCVNINHSTMTMADIGANNGVIHIMNAVLVPPSIDGCAFFVPCNKAPAHEIPAAEAALLAIP